MLRALMEKVDNMQKHRNKVSREIQILTKNLKVILKIETKFWNRNEECL